LAINEDVLEVLYILHEMNRDYQTAFHIMVKMQNKKLFEFLNKFKIEFDLNIYLGKLLMIDPSKTVDYLLQRYGKIQ